MRLMDEKARSNIRPFLVQSGLATATILVVLLFLDVVSHSAIIATLGSSVFGVFAMPKHYSSRTRPLLGGYTIGIVVGVFCYYLSVLPRLVSIPVSQETLFVIFAALAVGLAILLMVVTDTEHPPAAGMALGLVINSWDSGTIIFIVSAALFLAVIRGLLKTILIDLV